MRVNKEESNLLSKIISKNILNKLKKLKILRYNNYYIRLIIS